MPQPEIGTQTYHLNDDKIFDKRKTFMEAFSVMTISNTPFKVLAIDRKVQGVMKEDYFPLDRGDGCTKSKEIFTSCLQCIQVRNGTLVFI